LTHTALLTSVRPALLADVASWIKHSFTVSDYVIVKMDVEGAEFDIVKKLEEQGALTLIDVLAIECHSWSGNCTKLVGNLRHSQTRVVGSSTYESLVPSSYWGDAVSRFVAGLSTPACAHLNFTCGPKSCTRPSKGGKEQHNATGGLPHDDTGSVAASTAARPTSSGR
jgi:hypothetical protein